MKTIKDHIKRITMCALVLSASAVMLCGCGNKLSEGYWVLAQVTEGETEVDKEDLGEYGLSKSYIVTDKKGGGYAVLFGIPADFAINEKNKTMSFETGSVAYKVSGKKLTLSDSKVTMVFEKSKKDAPDKPAFVALANYSLEPVAGNDSGEDLWGGSSDDTDDGYGEYDFGSNDQIDLSYTLPREYFEGDWYGWWTIKGRTDFWKQFDGQMFDVMAEVKMDDDTFGTMTIWDADMTYDDPIAKMKILVSDDGTDPVIGSMQSDAGGVFLDGEVDNTTWDTDPGKEGYSNYMTIAATYVDDKGVDAMDYVFHLKKWGDDWSDFSEKPPLYDWYKELIDAGKPMPDTLPE